MHRSLSRVATGDTNESADNNTTLTFDPPDVSIKPPQPQTRFGFGYGAGGGGDDFGVLNNEHFDTVARDMQNELYEARIVNAEKEIEALHRNLQKERTLCATLRTQLNTALEQQNSTAGGAGIAGGIRATSPSRRSSTAPPMRPFAQATEPLVSAATVQSPTATTAAAAAGVPRSRLPGPGQPLNRRGSTGNLDRAAIAALDLSIPTFGKPSSNTNTGNNNAAAAPVPAVVNAATGTRRASISAANVGASVGGVGGTNSGNTGASAPSSAATLFGTADPMLDFSQDFVVPEVATDSEKMKMLVRRMNEMRRSARVEVSRLKEYVKNVQDENAQDEGSKSKATIADLKMQLSQLKEDNGRKAKLLANLKSAKTAEENSLEQWKQEAAQLDENCKR